MAAPCSFSPLTFRPLNPQPLLVSGPLTHPAGAALAAAWDGGSGGRLLVVGSSEMWADAWLERGGAAEGNAALAEAAVAVGVSLNWVGWSVDHLCINAHNR
jgi:hypothetical protein